MRDGDKTIHALNKYYDEYPQIAVEILSKGKSYAALAAHLDVSQRTLENWRKQYPEFEDACQRGKDKGQAWWENNSDENMYNKDYCSTRYIFKMKTQYKLKDGSEPVPQAPVNLSAMIGMDGSEHAELVQQIFKDAKERGEVTE